MMKWLLIPLFLYANIGRAQPMPIKNLVFEGAGIRGIAYAGVLATLEEYGYTENIEKVGGTSAGAITSLLFVLGYSALELETIISSTKLQKFNDGGFFFIGGFIRTKKRYGWYKGKKFSEWIGQLIEAKTGSSETTFEGLHKAGFKDLYVVATCLNKQQLIVLSHETYPEMKLKDAVRISMSIPLYYQAVFVDDIGNIYNKQNKENSLDVMVDGGVVGNFPIHLFDSTRIGSNGETQFIPNYETLGIRIDSDEQILEDENNQDLAVQEIGSFSEYITAFYIIVLETLNRNTLTEDDWNRTISVSSVGITPKVRKLSEEQKSRLIQSGRVSVEGFINNKL